MAGVALFSACASASTEAPGAPADAATQIDAKAPPVDAMVNLCPSSSMCPTAMTLGAVSGDSGSDMLMTSGYQSAWLRVRVTEDSNGVGGIKMSLTATLTSPPGLDFDVFMYVNEGSDVVECATRVGNTTTNGDVNAVRGLWGEGGVSNGEDDGRAVSIEIRPVSGVCAPDKMWQLKIVGNT
jgi:hypothetical protein